MKLFLFFVLFCCVVVGEKHHKSRPDGFDVQQFFKNRGVIEPVRSKPREDGEPFRVAFVLVGEINDLGWSYQHNQGRLDTEIYFAGKVQTQLFSSISDSYEDSLLFFTDLAESGRFQVIVGTTFAYQFAMFDVAMMYPDVYWIHISGDLYGLPNYSTAYGRMYQVRYLTGLLSGLMSSGPVGIILGVPIPTVYRAANALYKGIKEINETKQLIASWTGAWFDQDLELFHSVLHLDQWNVTLLTQFTDTFAPQFYASQEGQFSVGSNVDALAQVSINVLSSAMWNWSAVYIPFVESAMNGTWVNTSYWGGIEGHLPVLAPYSPLVADDVRIAVDAKKQELIDGGNDVFCGEWIEPWWTGEDPPGPDDCLSDAELHGMVTLHPDIVDQGFISIPTTQVKYPSGMTVAMQVLAAIALFGIFVSGALVIIWREKNAIHYSSPQFLILSLVGCAVVMVTVFLLAEVPTDNLCSAIIWTVCIGTTLFFVPLLAKTFRIIHIYHSAEKFTKSRLQTHELLGSVAVCLLVDIIILICFEVIESPYAKVESDDSDLDPYEYRIICKYPESSLICLYIILAWKGCLLLVGVLLTFLVRSVSRTFNESKHLSLSIYNCTVLFAVFVPLIAVLDDVNAEYLLISLALIFGTSIAYLVILLPKFWMILSGQDEKLSRTSSQNSRTGSRFDD